MLILTGCHQNPEPKVIYVDRVVHDSIVKEVIKADTIIKYIHEEYKENYNAIVNESLDDDYIFFTDYINAYNK